MQRRSFVIVFLCVLVFILSCYHGKDDDRVARLQQWDNMLDRHPKKVSDSLKTLDRNALSRSGKAYYDLLKVISDDKTYVNFTSDSLINAVASYYKSYDPHNNNYIRALAYQGIVRTRMGVKDSTVYDPLREANRLFQVSTQPDPSLGYMINYFLGNIHYNNRNFSLADDYFHSAFTYAAQEKDPVHRFDSYLALYWNQMGQKDFKKSKLYLDTLSTYYNQLPGKDYFILNAQAIYYDITGQPERALEREKMQLEIVKNQKELIDLSRLYFVISDRYVGLAQLDSALFYGKMALEMIEDTTYRQNYLYYQNVAHIAEEMGDYALSNQYLKKAMEMHQLSLRERLDMQIAEMEKKYDLSEAENEVLRARAQTSKTIIAALILGMILVVMSMYAFWNRRNTHLKLLHTEHQVEQQQLQADLLKEEAAKRKWLLQFYSNISDRLTFLQNEFEQLAQRYISANPKVHREMLRILKNTDIDLRDITKTLSPDDETFYAYTRLKNEDDFFSTSEKLLLMLLTCDADNRQLATFMNTSIDSIRVRKSQLKKKMAEKGLNTAIFSD